MSDSSKEPWSKEYQQFQDWVRGDLGISDAFFSSLQSDDDWTFVIKLHAVVEAAVNHLITFKLGSAAVAEIVSHLDIGDTKRGKMAFVRAMKLLPDNSRKFISIFSSLRNDLVHDARNFGFSIEGWLASRDKNQRKTFIEGASSGFLPEVDIDGVTMKPEEVAAQYPRYAIFFACIVVATRTHQVVRIAEHDHRIDRVLLDLGEMAFRHLGREVPKRIVPRSNT